jgi:glycosyltransferase involved in cell wall biosynthesis
MGKKKILFNGLGNRGWIGGLYYLKNIIFSCLQSKEIQEKYDIVVLIDPAHADIFDCYREGEAAEHVDIRVYEGTNKWKLMLYEMRLIWFGGVKYCYALELNKIGKLFTKKGIFWIPDFQHKTLPEFFKEEELAKKDANDRQMMQLPNTMVLSSFDSKRDLERFYPQHRCPVEVVHFVSYIENELRAITPEMEQKVREKFGLKKSYIYLPNQFWQHKNHIVAVKAIELLREQVQAGTAGAIAEYDFVFTGNLEDYRNPAYIDQLRAIMEADTVKDCIKLLGFVDRTEQLCIMKNAAFIVQPSLCEGWGTVLEDAKVLDKTVLLSDIPVHKEQKNDKCILFDPHQPAELAALMARVAEDAASPEKGAAFAGDMEQGIANMYREAAEYAKALERVFV